MALTFFYYPIIHFYRNIDLHVCACLYFLMTIILSLMMFIDTRKNLIFDLASSSFFKTCLFIYLLINRILSEIFFMNIYDENGGQILKVPKLDLCHHKNFMSYPKSS